MDELKPCLCGCEKLLIVTYKSFLKVRVHVECKDCGYRTKQFWRRQKAIEAWNRRAGDGNG